MPEFSVADFEQTLRTSGVLGEAEIADIDFGRFADARQLAKQLVEQDRITEWQAKLLLSGRKQMHVGGYLLLQRLERNELGDCYLARHRSLDRQVELQFLPKQFGKNSPQFLPFIETVQTLIKVDHPNLAHVFDVGEEVGRYFVVQERIDGQSLNHVDWQQVTRAEALRWVRELASAVHYLHGRSILHGSIDQQEIMVNEARQIQIRGLIKRVLEERVLGRNQQPDRAPLDQFGLLDRVALQSLIGDILTRTWGPQANAELLAAVVRLGQRSASLGEIESIAARLIAQPAPPTESDPTKSGETKSLQHNQRSQAPVSPRTQSSLARPAENLPGSVAAQRQVPRQRLIVAGLILGTILAIGSIATWAWSQFVRPFRDDDQSLAVTAPARRPVDDSQVTALPRQTTKKTSSRTNASSKSKGAAEQADIQLPAADDESPPNFLPVHQTGQTASPLPQDTTPLSKERSAENQQEKIVDPTQPVKGVSSKELTDALLGSSAPADASSTPPLAEPQKSNSWSRKKTAKPDDGGATPSENDTATGPATAASVNPEILDAFELPLPDGSGEFATLSPLILAAEATVELDLIFDPEKCGRGKNYFSIAREPDQRQWIVKHSNRTEDPSAKIVARFKVEEDQLKFAWDPTIDAKSNAVYLCNTCLEINSSKIKIVPLRKPISMDSLMLTEKSFSNRVTLDVPNLPADGIKIEIGKLDPKLFGDGRVNNLQLVNRAPATIAFKNDLKDQIFVLAIFAVFKPKVELRLEAHARNDGGVGISVTPKGLNDVLTQIDAISEQLFVKTNIAKTLADQAPYGEKTKRREEAKAASNALEEHQAKRQIAYEQADLIRNLVNVPIPLRVVYEFQNQKIVLAQSPTFAAN